MKLVDIRWWEWLLLAFIMPSQETVRELGHTFLVSKKRMFSKTYIIDIQQLH